MQRLTALLGTSFLTAAALCAPAQAAPAYGTGNGNGDWYLGAGGDVTWLNHSSTGGGGQVALGYRFWPSNFGDFRLEGEVGYHGVPNDSGYTGNTHYFTYMGNLYYDLNSWHTTVAAWQVSPYIGVGVGDATVKFGQRRGFRNGFSNTVLDFSDNDNVFAYQGMIGLSFTSAAVPNIDWSVGYKYLGTDKSDGNRLNANNVEIGLRYHF